MPRVLAVPIFVLLVALGAQVEIPLGPVPFILSDFFILLAALLLGSILGGLTAILYLTLGILGLAVFAGGGAGLEHLSGATGGYLIGYAVAAVLAGRIAFAGKSTWIRDGLATLSGQITIFICGLIWLRLHTGMGWQETFELGLFPFWWPIAIKFVALVISARLLRRGIR